MSHQNLSYAPHPSGGYPGPGASGGGGPNNISSYPAGGYQGIGPHGEIVVYPGPQGGGYQSSGTINPQVQQWFLAVDRDRSGHISSRELQAALVNAQGRNFSDSACRLMIEKIVFHVNIDVMMNKKRRAVLVTHARGHNAATAHTICRIFYLSSEAFACMFDKDKSGTIDLNEFQLLYNYINQWIATFRAYDHDSSGHIEESELSQALMQMGYRLSPAFLKCALEKSDPQTRSRMSLDQFIVTCVQMQRFTEAFRSRDTDLKGVVTLGFEDFLILAFSGSL